MGHNYHVGLNWTTDAIFRETPQEVRHYQKQDVLSVEMEIAAFYAICAKRKVSGAAAVVISDELARLKWEPHFGEKEIFRNLEQIFLAAGQALK